MYFSSYYIACIVLFSLVTLNQVRCMLITKDFPKYAPNGNRWKKERYQMSKEMYDAAIHPSNPDPMGLNSHNVLGDVQTKSYHDYIKAVQKLSTQDRPTHFVHDFNTLPGGLHVQKMPDHKIKTLLRVNSHQKQFHDPETLQKYPKGRQARREHYRRIFRERFAPKEDSALKPQRRRRQPLQGPTSRLARLMSRMDTQVKQLPAKMDILRKNPLPAPGPSSLFHTPPSSSASSSQRSYLTEMSSLPHSSELSSRTGSSGSDTRFELASSGSSASDLHSQSSAS